MRESVHFLRIKLRSFDKKVLDWSVKEIIRVAKGTGSIIIGPVLLPTKYKRITVLTSPHVDKDSRDQYKLTTNSRLLDIVDLTNKTVDSLITLELPYGVLIEMEAKVL